MPLSSRAPWTTIVWPPRHRRSALAEWRRRPPPRPRSAITIDPNTDAPAILRRVLNEPIADQDAEDAEHIDDAETPEDCEKLAGCAEERAERSED
jgi:hypothetical protein